MHDDKTLKIEDLEALWRDKDLAKFEGTFRTKTGEEIPVNARSPNELFAALTNLGRVPVGANTYQGIAPGDT